MTATHGQTTAETELLSSVSSGDMTAFERLYRLYEKRVFQYVSTFIHDRAVAEEVVADTMLAVWRGAATFACTSRISTWIFGIARHKALDAVRRMGRRQREVDLDGAGDVPDPREDPTESAHRRQVSGLTDRALSLLSREHQEILRLVFYVELPYDEIASLLSIPTNTVKTRVYYAKQQLKRQLERLGQKEPIS
jgi:RNA polymerase sigma-70 factor (ECF subfamily)